MAVTPTPQQLIGNLIQGHDLDFAAMEAAMQGIVEGAWTSAQIAVFLVCLRLKGEKPSEIAAAAAVLRHKAIAVPTHRPILVDTCGTGGDHSGSFNVSTAAALVAAAAGSAIAKHGNRAVSSRCGSANVLMELGINLDLGPKEVGQCIDEVGIGFLYAPQLHPAMKHVIGPRQEIGQRTLFNILGPLLNPAGAKRQVLGVFDLKLTRVMAEVLKSLGSEHVLVVAGTDGMDEISLCAPTKVAELKNGEIMEFILNPEDFGLSFCTPADIQGNDAVQNAAILRSIFSGKKGAPRDIVTINAAAALYVGGQVKSIKDGVALAQRTLDSGAANVKVDDWAALSQKLAAQVSATAPV